MLFIITSPSNRLNNNEIYNADGYDESHDNTQDLLSLQTESGNETPEWIHLSVAEERYKRLNEVLSDYIVLQGLSLEELSQAIFEDMLVFARTNMKDIAANKWVDTLVELGANPSWVETFVIYLQTLQSGSQFQKHQAQVVQGLIKEALRAINAEGWGLPESILLRQQKMIEILSEDMDESLLLSLCWVLDLPMAYHLND